MCATLYWCTYTCICVYIFSLLFLIFGISILFYVHIHIWIESLLKTFFFVSVFLLFWIWVCISNWNIFSGGNINIMLHVCSLFVISHKRTMNGIDYKVVSAASSRYCEIFRFFCKMPKYISRGICTISQPTKQCIGGEVNFNPL